MDFACECVCVRVRVFGRVCGCACLGAQEIGISCGHVGQTDEFVIPWPNFSKPWPISWRSFGLHVKK